MSVTYDEILHQPLAWREAISQVPAAWDTIATGFDTAKVAHAIFIGCGTSLYIAHAAARSFAELTGITAAAVPASEIFLASDAVLPARGKVIAFIVSRSGTTSEGLLAAEHLAAYRGRVHTVAITCRGDKPLAAACASAIVLPYAAERAVVMTQSFTTLLLALQIVAARWAGKPEVLAELATLPAAFERHLPACEQFGRRHGEQGHYDATIFLGLGAYGGLAEEATLKLKEMTQQPCEAYNPLEFRHGPISIVTERTLTVMIEGHREEKYIADVERDLRAHGAEVARLAPYPSPVVEGGLQFGEDLSDLARCCLYLPPLQLLALYRAQAAGLDPDHPRNLNQVVVLHDH